uniref:Uncharacterized protein n=1 Tax=viral metagenome TaxID=1070528 RepID=A0A6M3K7A6_9ZZZZ
MRFIKYLSNPLLEEDVNKFRFLDIKLVEKDTEYKSIVKNVSEKYKFQKSTLELLKTLNKELKKYYTGSMKFDFVLGEGKMIDDIKMTKKKNLEKLKLKYFQVSDELEKIKTGLEKKLKVKYLQNT